MNAEIPADVDLALRKHVERAVRPVRAGKCKKLTMREELLAHLKAIYLEEQSQRTDEQAALRAAMERFGEPAALTAELNASVGWVERMNYWEQIIDQKLHSWFDFRADESWLSFGLRCTVGLGIFNWFFGVLLFSVATVQSRIGDSSGFSVLWRVLALMTAVQPAGLLGLRGVYRGLRDRRPARRWLLAAFQAIVWSFVEVIVLIVFWWSFTGMLPTNNRQMIGVMESFLIGFPLFLLFGGWLCSLSKRNQDKHAAWTSLMIDE